MAVGASVFVSGNYSMKMMDYSLLRTLIKLHDRIVQRGLFVTKIILIQLNSQNNYNIIIFDVHPSYEHPITCWVTNINENNNTRHHP